MSDESELPWDSQDLNVHMDNYRKLSTAVNESGYWKDTSRVAKEVTLDYRDIGLVLNPDGTYFLMDYSG